MGKATNPTAITAEEGLPFIDIVREFDAPVELVFQAHVDPEIYGRWLGPRHLEVIEVELDIRNGGSWRLVHGDGENEYAGGGVVHTVIPNELIIKTFELEDIPNKVSLDYLRFEDLGNRRSRLSTHAIFESVEARDNLIGPEMEQSVNDGYAKLDKHLANST